MLNYVHQFFKIRVVFSGTKKVTPYFLAFLTDTSNSISDSSKYEKNLSLENFRANVLNTGTLEIFLSLEDFS